MHSLVQFVAQNKCTSETTDTLLSPVWWDAELSTQPYPTKPPSFRVIAMDKILQTLLKASLNGFTALRILTQSVPCCFEN